MTPLKGERRVHSDRGWALNLPSLNRNILARLNRNILRRPAVEPGCDVISEGRQLRMCLEIVVSRYFVDKVVIVPVCFVFASRRPSVLILFPAAHLLRVNIKKEARFRLKMEEANQVAALFRWYVFCLQLASFASCGGNKFFKTSWNVLVIWCASFVVRLFEFWMAFIY